MKKLLLLSTIIFITFAQARTQDYKVIHIKGDIEAESTHKNLARGTAFGETEKFQYKTIDARAVVINAKLGKRFILKENKSSSAYTKANLTPSMSNISSRAGGLNNRLDLRNHFDGKYVILGDLRVVINSNAFPMNDSNFFFIRYLYKGESIDKKLYHNGDTLIIIKDSLLRVDGKPIQNADITEMRIIYFSKTNGKNSLSIISSTFYPVFPNETELKQEVEMIISTMHNNEEINITDFINDYINEAYGKTNKDNIAQWYKANF